MAFLLARIPLPEVLSNKVPKGHSYINAGKYTVE